MNSCPISLPMVRLRLKRIAIPVPSAPSAVGTLYPEIAVTRTLIFGSRIPSGSRATRKLAPNSVLGSAAESIKEVKVTVIAISREASIPMSLPRLERAIPPPRPSPSDG
jgi:hypothetical protein